ncbi:MAG: hypothetical protein GY797_15335 [Deltaproteobacteria bacterium]|nr:hypothetical protein [Deltaproteobacteria bacterium]
MANIIIKKHLPNGPIKNDYAIILMLLKVKGKWSEERVTGFGKINRINQIKRMRLNAYTKCFEPSLC